MSKYVKIYNEQGLPLGFKGYNDVSSAIGDANVKLYDENGGLVGYSGQGGGEDYSLKYLTTIARGDGTISFNIWATMGTDYITSISYSTDDGATWETTNNTDNKEANLQIEVDVNEGDKILWKGVAKQTGCYDDDEGDYLGSFFSSTCNFDVEGNVMSLLYGDDFANEKTLSYAGQLSNLFYDYSEELTTSVINAEKMILPATTLLDGCYQSMFSRCKSLTTAPELPATTIGENCYYHMFNQCESLTTAPELPATTLASDCYNGMFNNCTSLTTAPELPATSLQSACYQGMFQGCTSLTTAPKLLPATTLALRCYTSMFNGCSSLTTAPELPATTLAQSCCQNMFEGCTSLTTTPVLPATTLEGTCYAYMFYGCTSLTTAPELPATTLSEGCYTSMFNGCSSLTTAPELPAATLATNCYGSMFNGCTLLTSITCLATNISATGCTKDWVKNVAASGTFTKAASMSSWTTGNNGIPSGWTTVDYAEAN